MNKKYTMGLTMMFAVAAISTAQAATATNGFSCVEQDASGACTKVKAPDGTVWFVNALEGLFSNQGKVENSIVVSSPATRACEAVGGQLPSAEQYDGLTSNFEAMESNYQRLTEKGLESLDRLLPGTKGNWFWTTFSPSRFPTAAVAFDGGEQRRTVMRTRSEYAFIRCVGRAE